MHAHNVEVAWLVFRLALVERSSRIVRVSARKSLSARVCNQRYVRATLVTSVHLMIFQLASSDSYHRRSDCKFVISSH